MHCWWLTFTLLISFALGQIHAQAQAPAASHKPGDQAEPSGAAANIAPDAPVIKIDGLCASGRFSTAKQAAPAKPAAAPASKAAASRGTKNSETAISPGCQTIITRAQFEKLSHVVAPNQPPAATVQLAHFYVTQLLYAQKGHEFALDNDPDFEEVLQFTYLQVLARAFTNHMQQQANAQANADFDTYYKQHPDEFEQVQVLQISVPKQKQHSDDSVAASSSNVDTDEEAAVLKAEAEKIRARAVAGEDFQKLEDEAYVFAGDPDDSPDIDMRDNTRAEMAPFDKEVFALHPGQISELLSGTEAWHIFKVVSKHMMPRDEARKRIAAKLMKASMDSLNSSVKPQFTDAYFGNHGEEPSAGNSN